MASEKNESNEVVSSADGTVVIVAGKVKIDMSEKLSNLYTIARRAKEEDRAQDAARYYDLILLDDPNSWEANFYHVYFQAKNCVIANIPSATMAISNCINNVIRLVKEHCSPNEIPRIIEKIRKDIVDITSRFYSSEMGLHKGDTSAFLSGMYSATSLTDISDSLTDMSNNKQQIINVVLPTCSLLYKLGDAIESNLSDLQNKEISSTMLAAWKNGINLHKKIINYFWGKAQEAQTAVLNTYVNKIKRLEPNYCPPAAAKTPSHTGFWIIVGILAVIIIALLLFILNGELK